MLLSLKATLELKQDTSKIDQDDRGLIMQLSPIYLQRLAEAEEKGRDEATQLYRQELLRERQTTVENILQARFGSLDENLRKIIEPLLNLSPEEFTPLLLQLSREELLDRFNQG